MRDSTTRDGEVPFSKSITLVSSIAGITEAPGLFAYSSSKHGVIGLMRALRPWAPPLHGIRANAICPWATATALLAEGVRERWAEEKLPINSAEDVARQIVQCAADGQLNGKAVFVSGGRGFDTEEGVDKTMGTWMGVENEKEWRRGQVVLGLVSYLRLSLLVDYRDAAIRLARERRDMLTVHCWIHRAMTGRRTRLSHGGSSRWV